MSVIEEVSLTELRVELRKDEIVSLELFFQVVEVADHESVLFVVLRELIPDVCVVSLDFNWLDVVIIFLSLCTGVAGHE